METPPFRSSTALPASPPLPARISPPPFPSLSEPTEPTEPTGPTGRLATEPRQEPRQEPQSQVKEVWPIAVSRLGERESDFQAKVAVRGRCARVNALGQLTDGTGKASHFFSFELQDSSFQDSSFQGFQAPAGSVNAAGCRIRAVAFGDIALAHHQDLQNLLGKDLVIWNVQVTKASRFNVGHACELRLTARTVVAVDGYVPVAKLFLPGAQSPKSQSPSSKSALTNPTSRTFHSSPASLPAGALISVWGHASRAHIKELPDGSMKLLLACPVGTNASVPLVVRGEHAQELRDSMRQLDGQGHTQIYQLDARGVRVEVYSGNKPTLSTCDEHSFIRV